MVAIIRRLRARSATPLLCIAGAGVFASCTLATSVAAASESVTVAVATVTVYPGDVIKESILADRQVILAKRETGAGYATRSDLLGKIARRTILPGQPIMSDAVRAPFAVLQGQSTLVVYRKDGLLITSYAAPLQSAGVGDLVSMRNFDTGSIFTARVMPDRSVAVDDQ